MAVDFLQTFLKAASAITGPHLAPVNQTTLTSNCAAVLQRASSLQSYQAYLTAARSAKAQKGATLSFERTVQAQAAQALDDMQAGAAAALNVIQQVNQTSFWTNTMALLTTTLKTTGPVSAQQIWNDVWTGQTNQTIRAALQAAGLTDAVAGAVTSGIAQVNASLALENGGLIITGGPTGGPATSVALRVPGTPPATVGELLRSAAFDQVVAAFNNGGPIYTEAVPAAVAMEPADIFAAGAIAARQHLADHVRGLQDVGLSTVAGADPITTGVLVTLLVIGLVLGAIGAIILVQCDQATAAGQPPPGGEEVCLIGTILFILGLFILGFTAVAAPGGGIIQAVALLGLAGLSPVLAEVYYEIITGGLPTGTIQQ
jgi:hypothetical protein